jgi:integrase
MEAAHRTRLAKGEVGIEEPRPVPTFKEFEPKFRKEMQSLHEKKPKTVTYYENGLNRLLEFEPLREVRLDKVDEALVAGYVAKRKADKKRGGKPLQVATINRELEVLRRMLRLAQEWKVIPTVPKVRCLPGERQRDRILTHEEEQAYLAKASHLLRDIASIILETGMRPEEVFRMRWENVHFKAAGNARYGYIHNPFGKTKYARRNIPMTQRVKAILEMRRAQNGKSPDGWVFSAPTKSGRVESVKSQHRKALKLSKARPFVLYSLRHTFLTRLGESSADPFTIQKIAGHSDITISQRYVHPTPERVEDAFTALEAYNAKKQAAVASERVQ